jgi:hypothetical protein
MYLRFCNEVNNECIELTQRLLLDQAMGRSGAFELNTVIDSLSSLSEKSRSLRNGHDVFCSWNQLWTLVSLGSMLNKLNDFIRVMDLGRNFDAEAFDSERLAIRVNKDTRQVDEIAVGFLG